MTSPSAKAASEEDPEREIARLERELAMLEGELCLLKTEVNRGPRHPKLSPGKRKRPGISLRRIVKSALGIKLQLEPYHPARPLRVPPRYLRTRPLEAPPTISVVTPSYNQRDFLEQTIESVLGQEYPQLQYVVQDGGSDDGSDEVLDCFEPRLHHAESRPDRGQAHAINLGFEHTDGELMAYLNSDDLMLPGTLHYVARYFHEHPEVDALYGHRVLIDAEGLDVGRWILPPHRDRHLLYADYVPQETLFWRRSLWERVGGAIDESFQFAIDWDLLLRFLDAGARIVRVPRFLGAFRVHDQQKTSRQLAGVGALEMDRLRHRYHGRGLSLEELRSGLLWFMLAHGLNRRLYQLGALRY